MQGVITGSRRLLPAALVLAVALIGILNAGRAEARQYKLVDQDRGVKVDIRVEAKRVKGFKVVTAFHCKGRGSSTISWKQGRIFGVERLATPIGPNGRFRFGVKTDFSHQVIRGRVSGNRIRGAFKIRWLGDDWDPAPCWTSQKHDPWVGFSAPRS